MKTKTNDISERTSHFRFIAVIVGLLLLVPLVLTLMGDRVDGSGWNWKLSDFVFAAILLFGAGSAIDYVVEKVSSTRQRILLCIAILVIFMLIWGELAVGLFGTPFGGS